MKTRLLARRRSVAGCASLLLVLVLALPAAAEAKTFNGHVSKVVDGDTIKVKLESKTRAFNLAGVDAPAGDECFADEAKAKLARMLDDKAAVKVKTIRSGAKVISDGKSINRTMVKRGFARAKDGGGAFGALLRSDEAAARAAGRGLHTACAAPDPTPPATDPPPESGDITGQAAIDRMETELTGMYFRNFSSSSNTSTSYHIHWCPSDNFRIFTESLYSSGGTSFNSRTEYLGNPWNVTEAVIREDGSRYAIVRGVARTYATNDESGPVEGDPNVDVRFEFKDGQWYWAGAAAQAFPGEADCQPVLYHG